MCELANRQMYPVHNISLTQGSHALKKSALVNQATFVMTHKETEGSEMQLVDALSYAEYKSSISCATEGDCTLS